MYFSLIAKTYFRKDKGDEISWGRGFREYKVHLFTFSLTS